MSLHWRSSTVEGHLTKFCRRFFALERDDRWLVVEAILLIGFVQAGLRTLSFPTLTRLLAAAKRFRRRSRPRPSRITWAVNAAARLLPGRTCLTDALAADVMLCRCGYQSLLRIGVKKQSGGSSPLEAHAWVESDGAIVAGQLETLDEYWRLPNRAGAA
jgi:hypothetical protein